MWADVRVGEGKRKIGEFEVKGAAPTGNYTRTERADLPGFLAGGKKYLGGWRQREDDDLARTFAERVRNQRGPSRGGKKYLGG